MKRQDASLGILRRLVAVSALVLAAATVRASGPPSPRVVDLKAADGTVLKATYFAAAKPGPGVLLFHQSNRTRREWAGVAGNLAAAGIHTLTVDMRGHGETGGREEGRQKRFGDGETAFQFLASLPGVKADVIGIGGAGVIGVENSVETARLHSAGVKSLVLLSGETESLDFLRQASQLPELFVAADDDEYPPIVEAMELLYVTASSPGRKFVHYSASHEAPWLWYEPFDVGKVPAGGGHGTDMFNVHPELPGIIVDWFVTTLVRTPGHAPADTLASASVINQIQMPGGVAHVTRQLIDARGQDPDAQLFPEITVSTIGQDHLRAGETKSAVEVLKLVVLAYPESADARETLAEAYLSDKQVELARQNAREALALLDSRRLPASSWTDTEPYRGEIRRAAQKVLEKVAAER